MNLSFLNNFSAPIVLDPGPAIVAIDIPDGLYRLTLTDSLTTPTRWEIVQATVQAGLAELVRGLEGTDDQLWPEGSWAYCAITAGVLQDIFARLAALENPPQPPEGELEFVFVVGELSAESESYSRVYGYRADPLAGELLAAPAEVAGVALSVYEVASDSWLEPGWEAHGIYAWGACEGLFPIQYYAVAGTGVPAGMVAELVVWPADEGAEWEIMFSDMDASAGWTVGQQVTLTLSPIDPPESFVIDITVGSYSEGGSVEKGYRSDTSMGSLNSASTELGGIDGVVVTGLYVVESGDDYTLRIEGSSPESLAQDQAARYYLSGPSLPSGEQAFLIDHESSGQFFWYFDVPLEQSVAWADGANVVVALTPSLI
ncbi:hypothetical protein ACFSB1_10675 [Halopseudomonas phragmitis]|uniref:Uncharacterized protein n=1 Tax=Halopseudomonas phragmitis TaxID=1931241 RepID=A0A1V0B9D2_9GAMM|nr:hypothetical protein [Halopseudomonas phragmitis]AQZ96548.1 hypothetical protein BVH74_18120 [Halopseudomonas phragmitis]